MATVLIKTAVVEPTPVSDFWLRMRKSLIESCHAINEYLPHATTDERVFLWSLQQGYRLQIAAIESFQLPGLKRPMTK